MTATGPDISRLRRMAAIKQDEPESDSGFLASYIERYPLNDATGKAPGDDGWSPTYDLNAAAADLWAEKASTVAYEFDFSWQGGSYARTGKMEHAQRQERYFRSRSQAKAVKVKNEI